MPNLSILSWSADSKSVIVGEGNPQRLEALDVSNGERRVLAAHLKYAVQDGVLSPDGQWLAFKLVTSSSVQPLFITPVSTGRTVSEKEWISISADHYHARAFWAPGAGLLYYYSDEDTFLCLYARRLNPATKQPQGNPFAVRHFHGDLRPAPGQMGYGLASDRLYIPLVSFRSNIWLAEPPEPNR
jgi:hypothetical protein